MGVLVLLEVLAASRAVPCRGENGRSPQRHSVLRGLRWDIVAAGPTDVHNLFPDTMYLCHCSLEMLKTW